MRVRLYISALVVLAWVSHALAGTVSGSLTNPAGGTMDYELTIELHANGYQFVVTYWGGNFAGPTAGIGWQAYNDAGALRWSSSGPSGTTLIAVADLYRMRVLNPGYGSVTFEDLYSEEVLNQEPDPCGPIDFTEVVVNPSRFDQTYALYRGGPAGEQISSVIVPGHHSHTFNYSSDEECEPISIYKMYDNTFPAEEIATHIPQAPDPPDPPELPDEQPEPDTKPLDYEQTEFGPVEADDEKDDGRKTREVVYGMSQAIVDTMKGKPEDMGPGEDMSDGAEAGESPYNSALVAGLEGLVPGMPDVIAPGSESSFSVSFDIPGISVYEMDIDLAVYSTPIAAFKGVVRAVMALMFFFMSVRAVRGAFA